MEDMMKKRLQEVKGDIECLKRLLSGLEAEKKRLETEIEKREAEKEAEETKILKSLPTRVKNALMMDALVKTDGELLDFLNGDMYFARRNYENARDSKSRLMSLRNVGEKVAEEAILTINSFLEV